MVELRPSCAEPRQPEAIDAMLPGCELLGIQRVAATGLFQRQQAATYRRDDFRFALDHPAFGVGRRQISESQTTSVGPNDLADSWMRSFIRVHQHGHPLIGTKI
jgi:hypothetical protein